MITNKNKKYRITLTAEQMMLISKCVEDCHRFVAGQCELHNTVSNNFDDKEQKIAYLLQKVGKEVHNQHGISLYQDLGYNGKGTKDVGVQRFLGNTYAIYREILHRITVDENMQNIYSSETLPSGDLGPIKIELVKENK